MEFRLNGVSLVETKYKGRDAICLTMPRSADQDPTRETLIDRWRGSQSASKMGSSKWTSLASWRLTLPLTLAAS